MDQIARQLEEAMEGVATATDRVERARALSGWAGTAADYLGNDRHDDPTPVLDGLATLSNDSHQFQAPEEHVDRAIELAEQFINSGRMGAAEDAVGVLAGVARGETNPNAAMYDVRCGTWQGVDNLGEFVIKEAALDGEPVNVTMSENGQEMSACVLLNREFDVE